MTENRVLSAHIRAGTKRRGLDLPFLAKGPTSYERKPAIWMEDRDHRTRRRVRFDRMPGADGNRDVNGDAHSIHVQHGLDDDGLPTADLLAAIDFALDWRAHEVARRRLIEGFDIEPDWSRTVHVVARAACDQEILTRRRDDGREMLETSGYLHGHAPLGEDATLYDTLHGRIQLFMRGELPATLMAEAEGRRLHEVLDAPWLAECPDVTVTHIHQWGGGDIRPNLVIHLENVRTTLAPVPAGIDRAALLPPGARFAD